MVETRKTIDIDAPPSIVFKALTDENQLVKWMLKEAKMDARVGGEYDFTFYWPPTNTTNTAKGTIVELVPDKKLSYTFKSSNLAPGVENSIVTWILEELHDRKTRVTVIHTGVNWPGYSYLLSQLNNHCRLIAVPGR